MQRRSFLAGILAAGAAPALAKAGVLMPVKQLWVPSLVRGTPQYPFKFPVRAAQGDTICIGLDQGRHVSMHRIKEGSTGIIVGANIMQDGRTVLVYAP